MKGIDEALDPENYDELESAGPPRPKILTAYLGPKKNAENIQWIRLTLPFFFSTMPTPEDM